MTPRILAICVLLTIPAAACSTSEEPGADTNLDTVPDVVDGDTASDAMDAPDTTEVSDPPTDDGFTDTIGMICSTDEECQNGLYCDGVEHCPFGFCQAGPRVDCSDIVNCTIDTCNEDTDSCEHEVDDSACDDSNPCTTDTCEVSTDTCVNAPIDCSDSVNCTLDTCDTTTGDCEHTIADEACDDADACTIDTCDVPSDTCDNELIDGDGDLHPPESCGGDDCDDADATIYTGAPEVCEDGIDQDCDGTDAPAGSCGCPVTLTVPSVSTGDTTTGTLLYDGTCGFGMSDREIVYRLDLTSPMDVIIVQYSDILAGYTYVKDGSCTGTEVGCSILDEMLRVSLAAGTYYVFVDGILAGIYGPYTLIAREATVPVTVTGNDTCSSAYTITADGTWDGDNTTLADDDVGTCGSTGLPGGRDAWFTFTLSSASTVHLDTFGTSYDTMLYVREGSCTGTEVGCNDAAGFSLASALDLTLAASTYYVAVDAASSTDVGTYMLSVFGL